MKIPRRAWPYILLIIMAFVTLLVGRRNGGGAKPDRPQTRKEQPRHVQPGATDPTQPGGRTAPEEFNRRPERLQYSKHARCRMGCRHIDEAEVRLVLENGRLNMNKSDMRASPDPRYAIEGQTPDGQEVRIIVAQGGRSSTIVTVIDLGKDWDCDCP